MLWTYIRATLRSVLADKLHLGTSLLALAVGMTSFALIACFVRLELKYDSYHQDADKVYRVTRNVTKGGNRETRCTTGAPLLDLLRQELPGYTQIARLHQSEGVVKAGPVVATERRFFFADPSIFSVLTIPTNGESDRARFDEPNVVLITSAMALKYFGDPEPRGRSIRFRNHDFEIVGVIEETPTNSHYHLDFLASFQSLRRLQGASFFSYWETRTWTYLKLDKAYSTDRIRQALITIGQERLGREWYDHVEFDLQPITKIHTSSLLGEVEPANTRSPTSLWVITALGIVCLAIACVNYMVLAASRASDRGQEAGIRMSLGATWTQLLLQFGLESALLSLMSMFAAVVLALALVPYAPSLISESLGSHHFFDPVLLAAMVVVAVLVAVVTGAYPAFILARRQPAAALKARDRSDRRSTRFREVLVGIQFLTASVLMIIAVGIYHQHRLLIGRDMGFSHEDLLVIPLHHLPRPEQAYGRLRSQILSDPRFLSATIATNTPGVSEANDIEIRPAASDESHTIGVIYVDYDYVQTLGVDIVAGRDFSRDSASDSKGAIILNQEAVEKLGSNFSVGQMMELFWVFDGKIVPQYSARVIGIVENYCHKPYQKPEPLVLAIGQGRKHYSMIVRTRGRSTTSGALEPIAVLWRDLFPDWPFQGSLLETGIRGAHGSEGKWATAMVWLAALGIALATFGLYGLASFQAARKKKEIAVRKTLGATTAKTVGLMAGQFLRPVLLSSLLAWPISYTLYNEWVESFAYRADLGAATLVGSTILLLVLGLLAVSWQAITACLRNPATALRSE